MKGKVGFVSDFPSFMFNRTTYSKLKLTIVLAY